jgi:hypothetical protein
MCSIYSIWAAPKPRASRISAAWRRLHASPKPSFLTTAPRTHTHMAEPGRAHPGRRQTNAARAQGGRHANAQPTQGRRGAATAQTQAVRRQVGGSTATAKCEAARNAKRMATSENAAGK